MNSTNKESCISIARPNPILAFEESINTAILSPCTRPNGFNII